MNNLFVLLTSSYDETTYLGLYDDIQLAKKAAQKYDTKYAREPEAIEWTDVAEKRIYSKNTYENYIIIFAIINEYEEI